MRNTLISWILGLVALGIMIGSAYLVLSKTPGQATYQGPGNTPSAPTSIATSTATSTAVCSGSYCFGLSDNGKAIALSPGLLVTVELPSAQYDQTALTMIPNIMSETSGAQAKQGDWAQTFEAVEAGTAILSVQPIAGGAPFTLTFRILSPQDAWESGMILITGSDQLPVHLKQGQQFLLALGQYNWSLSFSPDGIVTPAANSTTTPTIQGVYEASQPGTTVLTAVGAPICSANQLCPQYRIERNITFIVQ